METEDSPWMEWYHIHVMLFTWILITSALCCLRSDTHGSPEETTDRARATGLGNVGSPSFRMNCQPSGQHQPGLRHAAPQHCLPEIDPSVPASVLNKRYYLGPEAARSRVFGPTAAGDFAQFVDLVRSKALGQSDVRMERERLLAREAPGVESGVDLLQLLMPLSNRDVDHIGNRENLDAGQFHVDRLELVGGVA